MEPKAKTLHACKIREKIL